MKRFIKEQFYSNRQKTNLPKNADGFLNHNRAGLEEVLFDNLYPIDQFFILQCDSGLKDEKNRERAGWQSEQEGMPPIGVKVYRSWYADEDDEPQDGEKVEAEEIPKELERLCKEVTA